MGQGLRDNRLRMSALPNGSAAVRSAQDGMAGLSVANGNSDPDANSGAIVAVGKVKNVSLPPPDLSKVRSVETHTRALGIIQPPTDLRAIIDKSATFVANNGEPFLHFQGSISLAACNSCELHITDLSITCRYVI